MSDLGGRNKVSILIPTFNREEYLCEVLDCALSQSYKNTEICISDNASVDRSWDIIKDYCNKFSNIKAVRQIKNVGPVNNWIACANLASGLYSKLLFSDDLISKDWLETAVNFIDADPDCSLVLSSAVIGNKPFEGSTAYQYSMDDCRIPARTYLSIQLLGSGMLLPVSPGAMLFRTQDVKANLLTQLDGIADHDFNENGAGVDLLLSCITSLSYSHVTYMCSEVAFFRHHPGSFTIENKNQNVSKGYELARNWLRNKLSSGN